MKIARISSWSGKLHTLDLPITQEQYDLWRNGTVIQVAMAHLTPAEREFVLTGMTPSEWDEMSMQIEAE